VSSLRTPIAVVALLLAASCGGNGGSSVPVTAPSAPDSTPTTLQPSTPDSTKPAATTPFDELDEWPASYLRFGADGVVRVTADSTEQWLVEGPVGWATSDGSGGVLFTKWSAERFGPTWWQPADRRDAVIASPGDDPLIPARLNGDPVAVGSLSTDDCESNGAGHMVARDLESGTTTTLQCWVGGQDSGQEPDSFGGGLYVGVAWNAVHATGTSTATGLVFRNESGDVIEHPHNPFPGDCAPCELTAALSPNGSLLASVHRPDAVPYRPEGQEAWWIETQDTPATLRIYSLTTGDVVYDRPLSAGALPPFFGSWYDGRFVVLGPDRFEYPPLHQDVTGDPVRRLQQMLVNEGFDIEIDGTFGPATQTAVEAFHADRFGDSRSTVNTDTWTELGAPAIIIDTHTGNAVEVPGAVALEVTFADDTAAWSGDDAPDSAILRLNGIGPYAFGHEADEVEDWLTERLGPPDEEIVEAGQLGWPLEACDERRAAYWPDTGLTVAYTDRDGSGTCTATPRLAAWMLYEDAPWFSEHHADDTPSTPDLELRGVTTGAGIGLGSSVAEMRAVHPHVEFGTWGIDDYSPSSFHVFTDFEGRIEWNAVVDVQQALNERGGTLDVDGILGPATRQALTEFQQSAGIAETPPDGETVLGIIGPATLSALRVDPPDDAPVVYLTAGNWAWDF
jgi:peptidoglycan hydrolase-like protein with peptidoglycan-binding domain